MTTTSYDHAEIKNKDKQKEQLNNKIKVLENQANSHQKHNIELNQILADKENMIRKILRDLKICEK